MQPPSTGDDPFALSPDSTFSATQGIFCDYSEQILTHKSFCKISLDVIIKRVGGLRDPPDSLLGPGIMKDFLVFSPDFSVFLTRFPLFSIQVHLHLQTHRNGFISTMVLRTFAVAPYR